MANNPAAAAAAPHNDDGPRNLVICLDGTANQFSAKNTNVVKLFGVLDISERQLAYYDSGVGTYLPVGASSTWTEARQSIAQGLDLALAWNFDDHVKNAYSWLMNYYQAGDRIYLFGFSRGAYAARALVGMVERIGLLPAGNQSQVALAYDVYKSPEFVKKQGNLPRFKDTELATKYRGTFGISREVDFHFVGVWDTVSSLGGLDAPNLPFANTVSTVKHFRQALALDERRVKFLPEYRRFPGHHPLGGDVIDEEDVVDEEDLLDAGEVIEERSQTPTSSVVDKIDGVDANAGVDADDVLHKNDVVVEGDVAGEGNMDDQRSQNHIGSHKEVWFLGCHSDVGGSNQDDAQPALANVPFRWMLWEAVRHDLRLGPISLLRMPVIMKVPDVRVYLAQHLPQALNVWVGPNGMLPYDVAPGLVSAIRRQFDPVHRRRIVYLAADHDTSTPIIRPAPPGPQTDDRAQGKTESLKGIGYRALEYWRFTWTWYEMRDDAWVPIKGRAMHRGDGRYIREDQQLHRSVQRRLAYDHAIGLGDVAARPMGFETYPAIQAHLPPTWFAGANPWSAVRYAAMPGLWEDTEPLPPGLQ